MPSHSHNISRTIWYAIEVGPNDSSIFGQSTTTTNTVSSTSSIGKTGGSQSHNNVSPYIATYMWKRTA